MSTRQANRLGVIKAALAGKITNREGAHALKLGLRQFKRLRRAVRESGPVGVVHGNRGRPSSQRLSAAVRDRVVALLTGTVKLNDHHLADLLGEEGVCVSPASVRRIRRELRISPKRRRRPPQHRRRRARRGRRGELVLIDGSPCRWFDDGQPDWTLLGAIDDATGEVLCLTLRPTEDLHGDVTLLQGLLKTHGVPLALYGDRSGILVRNDPHWTLEEELRGERRPTQFGRMLGELGIDFIPARSPQAKGRIERLWGTLQDRLVAELRLRSLTTFAEALAYLPRFIERHNRRFARQAAEAASALRSAPRDLDRILGCRYERVVARDNTVTIPGRWLQVPPGSWRRSWHKAHVEVRELLDGRLLVIHPRHGVIAQQPPATTPFVLESRSAPRAKRARAQSDLPGSPQKPDRQSPRPRTRPRSQGRGSITNIRRPAKSHPWKKSYTPRPPAETGAGR